MRAIVLSAGDERAINAELGYPRDGLRTDHSIAAGAGVTTGHSAPVLDTLGRTVYPIADVETRLSAALRSRIVDVTLLPPQVLP